VSHSGVATARAPVGSAVITASSRGAATALANVIIAVPGPRTILVQSASVVSVTRGGVVLRSGAGVPRIHAGAILVSGSARGLLARVTGTEAAGAGRVFYATQPASLAEAFRQMSVHVTSLPTKGTLTFARSRSSLRIVQIQAGGRRVQVDPSAGPAAMTCRAPDGVPVTVSLSGPSFATDVTFSLDAALDISNFTVRRFRLAALVTASIRISTGSLSFDASVGPSYTCSIPLPNDLTVPSPVFIGPVELDGSITPSAGITVAAAATGTMTIAGPQVIDTVTADDGVQYQSGTWQAINANSSTGLQVIPAGASMGAALKASVHPFFRVDAGFAADLGAVYHLANIDLAFIEPGGDVSVSLASPFQDSQIGYSGPAWDTGFELAAGPELAPSGPGFKHMQQFLSSIGISLTTTSWALFDQKLKLASSPVPQVSAPPAVQIGHPELLTAQVPAGFAGDTVTFEGFRNGASSGTALVSAKVSGTTATATWTPAAAGTYKISALLFDTVFGSFNLPYSSAAVTPPSYADVIVSTTASPVAGPREFVPATTGPTRPGVSGGMYALAGQLITFKASGSAGYGYEGAGDCAGYPVTDAYGNRSVNGVGCPLKYDPQAPVPGAPIGALIVRIGDGPWMAAMTAGGLRTRTAGKLYLGFNDTYAPDNTGGYSVVVAIQ
jgi:hypothetical protein